MPIYMAYDGRFFELILGDSKMVVKASNIFIRIRSLFFLIHKFYIPMWVLMQVTKVDWFYSRNLNYKE